MIRPETLKYSSFSLAAITLLLFCSACACRAANAQELDKSQAESRLGEVTRAIGQLKEQLASARADHRKEQSQLRELDLAIQRANKKFRELEQQKAIHLGQLAELEAQRGTYLDSLEQRLDQLGEQLKSSYRMAGQSRMKLILNQDDPARLGRMLAYYDYLNRAQVEKISGLKDALTTLDNMQQSIDLELVRIDHVQAEQRTILAELDQQRDERGQLLAHLAGQINNDEARLSELEQNQQDLEALLERLSDVLADIPADLGSRVGVARQKGHLPMPIKGPVRHAFGQSRTAGLKWQGWLIGADTGTEVGSVAYGRVAFADWLRGYGLMIIIDHGQGYLSLYGHNESLLHEVGAWVEPGELISVVGSNPGSDQGLYFEIRKNGKAIDPAAWLAR